MRISDWSSDVCSSDLAVGEPVAQVLLVLAQLDARDAAALEARLAGERADPQRERGVVGCVGTGGGLGHGSASLERALHFAAPSRTHGPPRCSVAGLAKANGLACGPRLASRRPGRAGKHSADRKSTRLNSRH